MSLCIYGNVTSDVTNGVRQTSPGSSDVGPFSEITLLLPVPSLPKQFYKL